MLDLKPVQFPKPAHQASLQIIYQHNYGSDARAKQELCQLAGLPKRCLLRLHSQERDNVNCWHLQGVFIWRQLDIIAPEGEDTLQVTATALLLLPSRSAEVEDGQCHQASLSCIYYLKALTGQKWFTPRHLSSFFSPAAHSPALQYPQALRKSFWATTAYSLACHEKPKSVTVYMSVVD